MAKKYISKYTGPEIDSGLDNIPKLEGKLTELESEVGMPNKIAFSSLAEQECAIGGSGWYWPTGAEKHRAFPVDSSVYGKVTMKSATYTGVIAFLTDAYKPRYYHGSTIPFAAGTNRVLFTPDTLHTFEIPKGTAYIAMTSVDGSGNVVTYSDIELLPIRSILTPTESILGTLKETIDAESLVSRSCSLGGSGWYVGMGTESHKAFAVDTDVYNRLDIMTTDKSGVIGFVTDVYNPPYQNGDAVPYVAGTNRIVFQPNIPQSFEIPKGTAYVILTTINGSGEKVTYKDVTISSEGIMQSVDYLNKGVLGEAEPINVDASLLVQSNCSLGGSGWFMYDSAGRHKAFAVDTNIYKKLTIISNIFTYIGFVTDAYKPPYSNGSAVPYVQGTSRIPIEANTLTTLEIPYDAAYIVFNSVDGSSNVVTYSQITLIPTEGAIKQIEYNRLNIVRLTEKVERAESIEQENEPQGVFGIMTYNVGGWYNGSGQSIPSSEADIFLPMQKNIISRYSPDIIAIQEYRDSVVSGGIKAAELLKRYHIASSDGSTGFDGKGIASKKEIFDIETIYFANTDTMPRNYLKGYIYCNGRKVMVASAHLSAQSKEIARLEVEELLADMAKEQYVVLCMDANLNVLNSEDKTIMDLFSQNGYRYLNTDIPTHPSDGIAIDNIVVSNNIVLKSIFADTQKESLGANADHYPLMAYLEIY